MVIIIMMIMVMMIMVMMIILSFSCSSSSQKTFLILCWLPLLQTPQTPQSPNLQVSDPVTNTAKCNKRNKYREMQMQTEM